MPADTIPPTPFPDDDGPGPRQDSVSSGASGTRAKKAPPRSKATGPTGATAPPRSRPGRTPNLQKDLEDLLATPAIAYSFMGDEYAANLLATRTPAMAEAWYELAQKNPAVKRLLEGMVKGSAMGGVFLSTAAVVVPLLQHHGAIPGADPFAALYPSLGSPQGQPGNGGPIVPPPPAPAPASRPEPRPGGGGGAAGPGPTVPGPAAVSAAPVTSNGVPR